MQYGAWGCFGSEVSELLERSVGSALELALTGLESSDKSTVIIGALLFSYLLHSLGFPAAPAAPASEAGQGRSDSGAAAGNNADVAASGGRGGGTSASILTSLEAASRTPCFNFYLIGGSLSSCFGFYVRSPAAALRLPGCPGPGLLTVYTSLTLGSIFSFYCHSARATITRSFWGDALAVHLHPGRHTFYTIAPFPSLGLFLSSIGRIDMDAPAAAARAETTAEAASTPTSATDLQVTIPGCFTSHCTLVSYSTCGFIFHALYFVLDLYLTRLEVIGLLALLST